MTELLTLGALELRGVSFGREKPLLLLAYLSLEGTQTRRDVARLFWPGAANPMNSLSVALGQLRRADEGLVQVTDTQVTAALETDAAQLRRAAAARDLDAARRLYRGAFLAGLADDLGEELEEWVMTTRERLAEGYRGLLLARARAGLAADPRQSGEWAAQAWRVAGAPPPGPAGYRELHAVLAAAGHPDAAALAREAADYGLSLSAPAALPAPLRGRAAELARLGQVGPGEVLWLRGAPGLGKTALLRAAALMGGTLLAGRGGQPYATLRPLDPGAASPEAWARVLAALEDRLLLDDWEAADPESRRALLHAAQARAGAGLVFASRERPPAGFPELALRPLTRELNAGEMGAGGLSAPEEHRSGGLPALLEVPDGELADAYGHLLSAHSPRARQLLVALGVQPQPDLSATQAALALGAEEMAELLEALRRAHLLRGVLPAAPGAQRAWLDAQPSLETEVLSLLAPQLPAAAALPLYGRAHALTGSRDFPGFQEALAAQARTLLLQGRDAEAHGWLRPHARTPETRLLLARAQDALGHSPQALDTLDGLEPGLGLPAALVQVFRGRALLRLGRLDEARAAAEGALGGDLEARAHAHHLLGALALTARDHAGAAEHAERAAGLFLLTGDEPQRWRALCVQAVALHELSQPTAALVDGLRAVPAAEVPPDVLLNLGWLLERQDRLEDALAVATQAAERAAEVGQVGTSARAWNNVGVLHHKLGRADQATAAYGQAVALARQAGEVRFLALALGNLAELQGSLPLIEEALKLLEGSGQDDLVAYFEELRASFRARSGAP